MRRNARVNNATRAHVRISRFGYLDNDPIGHSHQGEFGIFQPQDLAWLGCKLGCKVSSSQQVGCQAILCHFFFPWTNFNYLPRYFID